jgi:hypothetical protein
VLLDPDSRTPIFLQLKEANEGALARHAGASEYPNHGQRVLVGQRLMKAASDIFLGWTSFRGHDYYVRQFRDMKGSVEIDARQPIGFASYCEMCGNTLSRAHARCGHATAISSHPATVPSSMTQWWHPLDDCLGGLRTLEVPSTLANIP